MQAEVRCHAVLCKSELIAQTIDAQLQERLAVALDEFMREKRRNQNSRLHHQLNLNHDITSPGGGNVRTRFLKQGQNFRPPIVHSNSAPKLGSISEGDEEEVTAADVRSQRQSISEEVGVDDDYSIISSSPSTWYVDTSDCLL